MEDTGSWRIWNTEYWRIPNTGYRIMEDTEYRIMEDMEYRIPDHGGYGMPDTGSWRRVNRDNDFVFLILLNGFKDSGWSYDSHPFIPRYGGGGVQQTFAHRHRRRPKLASFDILVAAEIRDNTIIVALKSPETEPART